jgi:hypothetical protein
MTSRSLTLVRAAFIALLMSTASTAVLSQPQEQPAVPAKDDAASAPAMQKPADAAVEQPQQGTTLVPERKSVAPESSEAGSPEKKDEVGGYTIKQGDTLWGISNQFLKDPFLWPFIWKENPSIANPDLIYPGNRLAIPNLTPIERALQAQPDQKAELVEKQTTTAEPQQAAVGQLAEAAPAEAAEEKQASNRKIILLEQATFPEMDSHSMVNAGFIVTEDSKGGSKDRIIGSKEGKTIVAYDDIVYVDLPSIKEAAVGDKFLIYKPLNKVKHPITGKVFGTLTKVLGVLKLTEKGQSPGIYTARITISFDAADIGSLLTPFQQPKLIYRPAQATGASKDITGYILEVLDERSINSQTDIVYLDKGSADGVEPGDRFIIYGKQQNESYAKTVIGMVQVFLVKEHTSTAVVRKSYDYIARGDRVEYRK